MICDFKEEMAWHHMRKAWVSYTQRHHCVPGYPVLLPCKWNKVVSKPGWTYSSLGEWLVLRDLCPLICALGRECPGPAGSRTSQQLGAPPAQFNARDRQPMLPQTSPSPPWDSVGEDGDTAAKMCSSIPRGRAAQLPGHSQGFSPEQGTASPGFTMGNDHKICCCPR